MGLFLVPYIFVVLPLSLPFAIVIDIFNTAKDSIASVLSLFI